MESKHNRNKGSHRMDEPSSEKTGIIDLHTNREIEIKKTIPTVCRQIRYYRELCNIEQKELARRLGINANAVSNWENGRARPDISLLPAICRSLNISLYMLLDVENPIDTYTASEQLLIDDFRSLNDGHKYAVNELIQSLKTVEMAQQQREIVKLTYFERSLAAGIGDPTEFMDNGEPMYLYANPAANKADCVFTVNGDSMEPEFTNGNMVYVQRFPRCGELQPGEIGAFIVRNETYIKVYEKDGLHSLNKQYKTMRFTEEDSVYLIGRVVGIVEYEDLARNDDIERYKRIFESAEN